MKQRLALAGAILQPRELLVLDEPTNGLDPQGTREIRRLVGSLAADGATVLISSHLLSEVEQMCDYVGIMSRGRLLAQDPLTTMLARLGERVRVVTPDPGTAAATLEGLGFGEISVVSAAEAAPHDAAEGASGALAGAVVTARPAADLMLRGEDVVAALVAAEVRVRDFRVLHSNLEDVFVSLTGEGFNVSG